MTSSKINVPALVASLDAHREGRDLSWRQMAKEIGVSPSLLSRLRNGYRPDADGFATLVTWLGQPAESFITQEGGTIAREPELVAQLAPLLRARSDLTDDDVAYLEDVIQATMRRVKAQKQP